MLTFDLNLIGYDYNFVKFTLTTYLVTVCISIQQVTFHKFSHGKVASNPTASSMYENLSRLYFKV